MKTPYRFLLAGLIAAPMLLLAQTPAPSPTGGGAATANPAGPVDPFARGEAEMTEEEREANRPRQISICLESFSVDLADAAALQRAGLDDGKLYKELVDRGGKGKAVQEQFMIVRARSGEKAILENISEIIYPTEFEPGTGVKAAAPPPQPNAGAQTSSPAPAPSPAQDVPNAPVPATPTSFETRNTGATLEIEPTLAENNEIIDLRIAPDLVTYVGRTKYGQGLSETETPVFETQRTNTALTLRAGHPCLLGTPSRPPVSQVDPNSAKRVWFTFVTPTVVMP